MRDEEQRLGLATQEHGSPLQNTLGISAGGWTFLLGNRAGIRRIPLLTAPTCRRCTSGAGYHGYGEVIAVLASGTGRLSGGRVVGSKRACALLRASDFPHGAVRMAKDPWAVIPVDVLTCAKEIQIYQGRKFERTPSVHPL